MQYIISATHYEVGSFENEVFIIVTDFDDFIHSDDGVEFFVYNDIRGTFFESAPYTVRKGTLRDFRIVEEYHG
jgi:hypothetical protein